mgnify:CR=1 FL=1
MSVSVSEAVLLSRNRYGGSPASVLIAPSLEISDKLIPAKNSELAVLSTDVVRTPILVVSAESIIALKHERAIKDDR